MMSSVIAAFRHSFHFYLHSARRAPYLYERRQRVPAGRVTAASPCRPKWGGAASTRRRLSVARLSEAVTWWAMIIDSTRSINCRMRRRMVTSMGHNDDVVADSNCVVNWWDVTTMLQSLPLVNISKRFVVRSPSASNATIRRLPSSNCWCASFEGFHTAVTF